MIDLEDLKELSITINFTLFLKINISEINIFKVYKQQQQQKKRYKNKNEIDISSEVLREIFESIW